MLDVEPDIPWRVTDLKQYVFCPRVLYYHACLPDVRPETYKMAAGVWAGQEATEKERRRSLRPYGLRDGLRTFNVSLVSARLGLRGEVDMVIDTEEGGGRELIPVDYKLAEREGKHFKLQLAAYALLLRETRRIAVRRGFLYLIPLRRVVEVPITGALTRSLDRALKEMGAIMKQETMPSATRSRGKCMPCEFRRFCNDSR